MKKLVLLLGLIILVVLCLMLFKYNGIQQPPTLNLSKLNESGVLDARSASSVNKSQELAGNMGQEPIKRNATANLTENISRHISKSIDSGNNKSTVKSSGGGGGGGGGSASSSNEEITPPQEVQPEQTICQRAQYGGLCSGLDLVFGENYSVECCAREGACC